MPAYAKLAENAWILLLVCAAGLLSGCDRQDGAERFEITQVDLKWSNGRLRAELHQKLILSNEAQEALRHGVPLTIEIEVIFRNTGNQTRAGERLDRYEIRYLPLSDRFQLTLPGGEDIETFARLRHLLANLANQQMELRTGPLPDGNYELLARARIDQRRMPISMRLPTMFDPKWQHDSDWSSWPLDIATQT